MKKKELYEQPLSQQIELQQEQLICASDLTSDETQKGYCNDGRTHNEKNQEFCPCRFGHFCHFLQ